MGHGLTAIKQDRAPAAGLRIAPIVKAIVRREGRHPHTSHRPHYASSEGLAPPGQGRSCSDNSQPHGAGIDKYNDDSLSDVHGSTRATSLATPLVRQETARSRVDAHSKNNQGDSEVSLTRYVESTLVKIRRRGRPRFEQDDDSKVSTRRPIAMIQDLMRTDLVT